MDKNQKSFINPAILGDNNDDEIIIRDAEGNLKVWQHGSWQDFQDTKDSPQEGVGWSGKDQKKESKVLDTGLEGPFLSPLKPALNGLVKKEEFIGQKEKGIDDLYQKKETKPPEIKQKKYGINKIVEKVNEVLGLRLNLEAKKRLKNILFAYSRHARSLVDSLEILQSSKDKGGMDLKLIMAEKIMAVVKNILERIEKEGGIVVDEQKLTSLTTKPTAELAGQQFKFHIKTPDPTSKEVIKDKQLPSHKSAAIKKPIKEAVPAPRGATNKGGPVFIKPKLIKKTTSAPSDFPRVTRPTSLKAKQITEVKKKPVILGPVEELAAFSLVDFRGLDDNPQVRVDKILKKINALAEDSLTKKAEGIRAWRQSEVYQHYLRMGEESIRRGLSIKQLINEKMANKEEVLNMEEFEALSDLSRQLRF